MIIIGQFWGQIDGKSGVEVAKTCGSTGNGMVGLGVIRVIHLDGLQKQKPDCLRME